MLRSFFGRALKAPAASYPPFALQNAEREQYTLPGLALPTAQAELYQRLSWVQIAIRTIADAVATQPLQVKRQQGEDTDAVINHPFEVLLQKPNPLMSRFALLAATTSFLKIAGNAYWWLNKPSQSAPPDEIWLIPSQQITPVPDGRLYLAGYDYDAGTGQTLRLPVDAICHFQQFNPGSQFVGLSAIEALADVATGDMAMQRWNTAYFAKNNAKLPGALTFAQMIPDAQWQQIQAEFKRQYGGTERNLLMLRGTGDSAVNWVTMAASQKDMEFLAGRQFAKEEIFQMFGVPPGMLDKNATEANATAAKGVFSELTLWPTLTLLAETITNGPLRLYGENLVAMFDDPRKTDRALELQEQAEYARTHTIDEVRARWYEDGPIGDERGNLLIAEITAGGMPGIDLPEKEIPPALAPFAGQPPEPEEEPEEEEEPDEEVAEAAIPTVEPAEKALLPVDGTLGDLRAWRAKSKARGKLAEFASDAISADMAQAVKALGATDWTRGFDWIPQYAALKAGRQPDRAYEDKLRKVIAALLKRWLDATVETVADGGEVDYTGLANEVKRAILPSLTNAAIDEAMAQAGAARLTFDLVAINDRALAWAKQYSYELVKGITETTQKLISKGVAAFVETPGMTVGELRSLLEQGFSEQRAAMIATTEVTRAYTQGTQITQAQLADAGIRMQRIWHASGDEKVCELCGPLDGKAESEWEGAELPRHVNCRCWDTLEIAE